MAAIVTTKICIGLSQGLGVCFGLAGKTAQQQKDIIEHAEGLATALGMEVQRLTDEHT